MTNTLVGTWMLESAEDLEAGVWEKPFGETPKGYFTFGPEGCVSVQFMKSPLGPDDIANENYLAYFGTYTVDAAAGLFTTTVMGSISPSLVGTKQVRQFKIENGKLYVGDMVTFRRRFSKVTG